MTDKTNFPAGRCDKPNFHNRAPVGESITPKQSGARHTPGDTPQVELKACPRRRSLIQKEEGK